MHAYVCLVILAVVSLPAHTFATEAQTEADNAPATPKPLCIETMCPRLYMPVCGLVDDELVTLPSRCVLNNKIRCSSALQKSLGKKAPRVRFLDSGPCSLKTDNSMPIDSNDEIIEIKSSAEADDASKDEDNANNKEFEHVETHDSGESGESGESNAIQHHNVDDPERREDQAELDDNEAEADNSEAEMDQAEAQEDGEEE